jgi:hypothetical protein
MDQEKTQTSKRTREDLDRYINNNHSKMRTIAFKRRRWWQNLLMLWPPYRRYQDAQLKVAIEHLMRHPEEPCIIEHIYIPNGYGTHPNRQA